MTWTIDPSHSQITFSVRHMMISNVRGRFEKFSGSIEFDETDPLKLAAQIDIDASSINTREERRDAHLRSADFFMSDEHPTITFRSARVEPVTATTFKLHGELTMRGVTHPVTLDATFEGIATSPWGQTSAGFSAHAVVDRETWGLVWNQALETGGILVGKDVRIDIEVEVLRQTETVTEGELVAA